MCVCSLRGPRPCAAQRTQQPVLNKGEFAKLEQALGLNFAPLGLLNEPSLRQVLSPMASVQYDWMHLLLVQGTIPHEINLAMAKLAGVGFSAGPINDWLCLADMSPSKFFLCMRGGIWKLIPLKPDFRLGCLSQL